MAEVFDQPFIDGTPQTHGLEGPLGAHNADLELQIQLHLERMCFHYPAVRYFRLNRDLTKVDDLYGEPIGGAASGGVAEPIYDGVPTTKGKVHNRARSINVQFVHGDQKKLLKAYGMEGEHLALAIMSARQCRDEGLQPKTGDLFEYLGIKYEVRDVKFADYFLNTQVPLSIVATIKQSEPDVEDG